VTFTLLFAVALAPVLVAYLIAAVRDPLRYVLPPYAVSLPFSSLLSVGPGPFGSASSLLGLLLGATLLVQLATTRRSSARLSLAVPVWLAFLALCALSFFWSIAPTVTVNGVLVLSSLVVLFAALALTEFDRVTLRRFENAVVLGGVLVVCYGVAQLLFLGGLPSEGGAARFGKDLLDPNNQAASLLLPLAITAWRALTDSRSIRWVHAGAMLLLALGITMTGSRGGFLAAAVVLGTVLMLSTARRAVKTGVTVAAILFVTVILVVQPAGVGARQLERDTSSGRTDIWTVALDSCSEYCITGAGWGGFPTVYKEQLASVPDAKVRLGGVAYQPHNILLLAVVEAGVLGLALLVLGLGIGLLSALRLPSVLRGPPAAALLGNLVSSMFLSNLEYKFFWAMLAYVVMSESVAAAERRRAPAPASAPQLSPSGV
jgi:O-antigen ligase